MASVVVMSGGGIKSAATAGRYAKTHELVFVHVNYGQASASREIHALESLMATFPGARILRIAFPHFIQLQRDFVETPGASGSQVATRTGRNEPQANSSPGALRGLMPMLLSAGMQAALRAGSQEVAIGLTRKDDAAHLGLPGPDSVVDHRREFLHAYNIMLETALRPRSPVQVKAPLMELTYAEVIQLAFRFRVPLDKTWTCEGIGPNPCGQCGPCKARAKAFAEAALADPAATPPPSPHIKGPGLVGASAKA